MCPLLLAVVMDIDVVSINNISDICSSCIRIISMAPTMEEIGGCVSNWRGIHLGKRVDVIEM